MAVINQKTDENSLPGTIKFSRALFLQRIDFLIEKKCAGNKSKFNEIIGQRYAEYRWRTEQHFPRVESLVKIANHFGVTMDWLLGLPENASMPQVSENIIDDEVEERADLIEGYKRLIMSYEKFLAVLLNKLESE